ncbi:hypothetical protein LXL04_015752 [Taraxacum kok-saghyz]
MSLFKVPMGVLKTLEQLRSRFFRGVDQAGKKMAWISWDKVCASKENGGLGVGSFYALDRALLFKWVWRFKAQPCAFWVKVVKAIHGSEDSIGSPRASVWRDILRSGVDLVNKWIDLKHFCKKLIGDGVNTRFWKERIRMCPLLLSSPNLGMRLSGDHCWEELRRLNSQGQELSALIDTVQLNQLPDKWVWDLSSDGRFSVASARHYVDDTLLGGSSSATRWVSMVPIKVNVFAWKMMCDALPTRWNLSQRGLELNSMLCHICGLEGVDGWSAVAEEVEGSYGSFKSIVNIQQTEQYILKVYSWVRTIINALKTFKDTAFAKILSKRRVRRRARRKCRRERRVAGFVYRWRRQSTVDASFAARTTATTSCRRSPPLPAAASGHLANSSGGLIRGRFHLSLHQLYGSETLLSVNSGAIADPSSGEETGLTADDSKLGHYKLVSEPGLRDLNTVRNMPPRTRNRSNGSGSSKTPDLSALISAEVRLVVQELFSPDEG